MKTGNKQSAPRKISTATSVNAEMVKAFYFCRISTAVWTLEINPPACAFTLLLIALSSASSGTTRTEMISLPAPAPTAVPGTELRRNVATVKPGYEVVKRERSVDVVSIRFNRIMGTYVCPCNSTDTAAKCDLVFSPQQITCKLGSCTGGSCLLTAAPRVMRQ